MDNKTLELLELLTSQVNDIKANMATKDDLKGFATKEDLKDFATKEDLKGFATKEDLKDFATKDDLKNLATKDDIKFLSDELHIEIQAVYDEVKELRQDLGTMEILTTKNAFDIAKLKAVR